MFHAMQDKDVYKQSNFTEKYRNFRLINAENVILGTTFKK